jgi:hypothetical protein
MLKAGEPEIVSPSRMLKTGEPEIVSPSRTLKRGEPVISGPIAASWGGDFSQKGGVVPLDPTNITRRSV